MKPSIFKNYSYYSCFLILLFSQFALNKSLAQCSALSGPSYSNTCSTDYFTAITASGTGVISSISYPYTSCVSTYFNYFSTQGASAIRQNQAGAAAGLEDLHQQHEEQVGGLAGAEFGREIGFNAVFLHAAEGRISDDDIHAFLGAPVAQRSGERVAVADVGRDINAMQQQIGHAQHVRQVLFLDAGKTVLDDALVIGGLGLLAQMLDGARQEAAGAAGGIEDGFAKARIDLLDDELGDGARCVKLTGIAGGLEIF